MSGSALSTAATEFCDVPSDENLTSSELEAHQGEIFFFIVALDTYLSPFCNQKPYRCSCQVQAHYCLLSFGLAITDHP